MPKTKLSDDYWNLATYGKISGDPNLQALDSALKRYRESPSDNDLLLANNAADLILALTAWKSSAKGRTCTDNRLLFAIETLDKELDEQEELEEAMWELRRANEQNLETLFRGKQLVVKPSQAAKGGLTIGKAARSLEDSLKKAGQAVNTWRTGADAKAIVQALTGEDPSILGASQNTVLSTLSKVPLLSMAKTGVSLGVTLKRLAGHAWVKYRNAERARSSFAPGAPEAALNAVLKMIDEEIREKSFDAATQALSLATDIAGAVTTGGFAAAVFGGVHFVAEFAENLGNFFYTVYLFSRDQGEAKIANKYLTNGPWDLSLFRHSPLLGCYVLACSPTSAIILMSVHQYGKPGWMAETEQMKEKADPLIDKAGELIRDSRYEIPELAYSKGGVAPSINKLSNLFLAKVKKLKYESETKMDMGAKFKPHAPTKAEQAVIKTRITGTGSHS